MRVVAGLAAWALFFAACAAEAPPPREREPASIVDLPTDVDLPLETSVRLAPRVLDRHGRPIPEARLRYESADPSIASVDAQGWVRGEGPGKTEVVLRTGNVEGRVPIRVRHQVHEVQIEPSEIQLLEDEASKLDYVLLNRSGEAFEAELEARWRSENVKIARVDAGGRLEALAPGVARIVVVVGEGEGEAHVEVLPRVATIELRASFSEIVAGEESVVQATVRDRRGQKLERTLAWSSSDPAVATVNSSGRVFAIAPGEVQIRAEAEGAWGELTLRVLPAVDRVEILPSLTEIYEGGSVVWTARAYDAAGEILENRRILWGSADPDVARVDAHSGRVEGVSEGTTLLTARAGPIEASAEVRVFAAPELEIDFEPPTRVEPPSRLAPPFRYLGPLPSAWRSSDPSIASVEGDELVIQGLGKAAFILESGGLSTQFSIDGSLRFSALAAGDDFACGLSWEGRVWCWGYNHRGQLGDGGTEASWVPVPVGFDPAQRFWAITAGSHHACALTDEGTAHCWGDNRSGELGAETEAAFSPLPLPSVPEERFTELSAGAIPSVVPSPDEGSHTCGITVDGRALCWGNGRRGQMGNGTTPEISPPVEPSGGHLFKKIRASTGYTCGLADDDQIYCWGHGPLGTPALVPDPSGALMESATPRLALYGPPLAPPEFPPVPEAFDELALGWRHACAITSQGAAYCWGAGAANALGTSGYYKPLDKIVFGPISGGSTPASWQRLFAGSTATCGLDPGGNLHCWGRVFGVWDPDALCSLPTFYNPEPVLPDTRILDLAIGRRYCEDFACALDEDGVARCWGYNSEGQSGQPPSLRVPEPTPLFPD